MHGSSRVNGTCMCQGVIVFQMGGGERGVSAEIIPVQTPIIHQQGYSFQAGNTNEMTHGNAWWK